MRRTTIPVLLVVLTMLCGVVASAAASDTAKQDSGAMAVPGFDRHQSSDQILDLYGDTGDGSKGDPGTMGDGFGFTGDTPDIVPSASAIAGIDDQRLLDMLLRLMDYFTILH